eukprot:8606602-Alexandrium_andersonii.AAC.1
MSASLVGSEMCIRDSRFVGLIFDWEGDDDPRVTRRRTSSYNERHPPPGACLLYTSDAADDM